MSQPKIAVVSDHLATAGGLGGAEYMLLDVLNMLPAQNTPLYTTVYNPKLMEKAFDPWLVQTSFIQRLPLGKTHYQYYLPLMPLAVEQLNLMDYDLVLSFHHLAAKGIITRPDAVHISYCQSPARYVWDQYWIYQETAGLKGLKKLLWNLTAHYFRMWDTQSATRADYFIANSAHIAKRIEKFWRREAAVVHPSVDVDYFFKQPPVAKEDFYVAAGRLVGYKRFDLAIEAFNRMKKPLVIVGDGSDIERLKKIAGPTIRFTGRVTRQEMARTLQQAQGLIFPGLEDFGILPVEAQACGTPVIAYGKGGILETVVDGETGLFFDQQTPQSLIQAVTAFENLSWDASAIKAHAKAFSQQRFAQQFQDTVNRMWLEKHPTAAPIFKTAEEKAPLIYTDISSAIIV